MRGELYDLGSSRTLTLEAHAAHRDVMGTREPICGHNYSVSCGIVQNRAWLGGDWLPGELLVGGYTSNDGAMI